MVVLFLANAVTICERFESCSKRLETRPISYYIINYDCMSWKNLFSFSFQKVCLFFPLLFALTRERGCQLNSAQLYLDPNLNKNVRYELQMCISPNSNWLEIVGMVMVLVQIMMETTDKINMCSCQTNADRSWLLSPFIST